MGSQVLLGPHQSPCCKPGAVAWSDPPGMRTVADSVPRVFRRTWTDAKELLKEKSFFILSFVFLSEFVIRQVQTNIY